MEAPHSHRATQSIRRASIALKFTASPLGAARMGAGRASIVGQTLPKLAAGSVPVDAANQIQIDQAEGSQSARVKSSWKRGVVKAVLVSRLQWSGTEYEKIPADELMIENALMQVPVFSSCSQDFVTQIAEGVRCLRFHPGNVIGTQSQPGNSMIVVINGSVDVYVDKELVAVLEPGDHFGESLMLGLEAIWDATLYVSSVCTVCEVTNQRFRAACGSHFYEKKSFQAIVEKNLNVLEDGTLVKTCVVFHGLSGATMCAIDAMLVRRLFFPGETMLKEGAPGNELYVLVQGSAKIEIAGRLVQQVTAQETKDGSCGDVTCFGELGLLALQDCRSATVVAETVCHTRILYRSVFLKILDRHKEAMELQNLTKLFQDRYAGNKQVEHKGQALREVKTFKSVGCSDEFLDFLGDHLEPRIFLEGQTIIDEHNPDDRCMYLITQGKASVMQQDKEVATLHDGAVAGEIIVLGLATRRTATVIAASTCYIHVLHQAVVVRGLELFPDERSKVLMMAASALTKQKGAAMAMSSAGELLIGDDATPNGGDGGDQRSSMEALLKNSPLLCALGADFIEQLSRVAIARIYMPGDLIIEQGCKGDSMFVMVSGTASVHMANAENFKTGFGCNSLPDNDVAERRASILHADAGELPTKKNVKHLAKVGSWTAGSVGGEIAMLGISQTRSASILAESICSLWEISSDDALPILDRFPDAQKHFANVVIKHLEGTVPTRLGNLALFHNFDRKFRTLLVINSESRAYFPSHQLVREGQSGERLFVINVGRVRLMKRGVHVRMYAAGSHFGSTVMLGIHKAYFGSLIALQTCHVLTVTKSAFAAALEQYPQLAAAKELKKSEKIHTEALRDAAVRTATRKLIWRRYQNIMQETQCVQLWSQDADKASDPDVLERFLQAWKEHAKYCKQRRNKVQLQLNDASDRSSQLESYKRNKDEAVEKAKALRATLHGFPVAKEEVKLPQLSQDQTKLVKFFEGWPTPRPSPHYQLHVFQILNEPNVCPIYTPRNSRAVTRDGRLKHFQNLGPEAAADTQITEWSDNAFGLVSQDDFNRGGKFNESALLKDGEVSNSYFQDYASGGDLSRTTSIWNARIGEAAVSAKLPSITIGSVEDSAQCERHQLSLNMEDAYGDMLT